MILSKRVKNITNKRFGKLLVIKPAFFKKDGSVMWLTRCNCGEEFIISGNRLRTGKTTHCGCERNSKGINRKDLLGKKFGKLLVVGKTDLQNNHGNYLWDCICECGENKFVETGSLMSGNTKSCGCVSVERMRNLGKSKRLPNNEGLTNALYSKYVLGSKRRSIDFNLSKDEFISIIKKDCCYCGDSPSQIFKGSSEDHNLLYNGIDRKDNKVGYIKDNCVPCCKTCNYMKTDMTLEKFISHVKKINDQITNFYTKKELNNENQTNNITSNYIAIY